MSDEIITCVTAMIVTEDGCASHSAYVPPSETVEGVTEEMTQAALEAYEENIGSLPLAHRVVVYVSDVPTPRVRTATIRSSLPQVEDDAGEGIVSHVS